MAVYYDVKQFEKAVIRVSNSNYRLFDGVSSKATKFLVDLIKEALEGTGLTTHLSSGGFLVIASPFLAGDTFIEIWVDPSIGSRDTFPGTLTEYDPGQLDLLDEI